MRERNLKIIFAITLIFSILLEFYVRTVSEWIYSIDGFAMIPYIDNVMHLFWGLNIFLLAVIFLKLKPLDAVIVVFLWQMFWEPLEIIGDIVISQPANMMDHFFFDGIKDTFFDVLGAGMGWFIYTKVKRNKKKTERNLPVFRRFGIVYSYAIIGLCIIGLGYFLFKIATSTEFTSPDLFATIYILISAPVAFLMIRNKTN